MDKTALFFNSLAQRFGKENDLSDITWALCQASPSFKEKLKGVGMQTVNEVTKVLHGAGLDFEMII